MDYEFANFRLEPESRRLTKDGALVPMTAKVFDILLLLVRNPGRVIAKDEFFAVIWPDTIVEEATLSQNIFVLRKLLGDKTRDEKIILTHTGVGYSFAATVRQTHPSPAVEIERPVEEFKSGRPESAREPRKLKWLWPAIATLSLAIALLLFAMASSRNTLRPAARKWALRTLPGVQSHPTLSPDGSRVAFTYDGGSDPALAGVYLQDLPAGLISQTTARRISASGSDSDSCPAWSPDGQQIVFVRQGPGRSAILLIAADGSGERKIGDMNPASVDYMGCLLTFTPDGRSLVIVESTGLQSHLLLFSLQSGLQEPLIAPAAGIHSGDAHPVYSPDGKNLAFVRRDFRASMDVFVAPVSASGRVTGEPRRLTSDRLPMHGITWTPDGRAIIYSATRQGIAGLWRASINGGTPESIPGGEQAQYPSFARSGGRLSFAVPHENRNLWKVRLSSLGAPAEKPSLLLSSTRRDEGPVFSRDGRRLSFFSDRTGSYEIWVCDSDGSRPRALTSFGGAFAGLSNWSVDGSTIIFDVVRPESNQDIFSVPSDGGKAEPLIAHPLRDATPEYSRDGESIYFSSDRSGRFQIWQARRDGTFAQQLTKEGGLRPFQGTDGYIYYASQAGSPKIRRIRANGGPEETVIERVKPLFFGHWAIQGTRIFFLHNPEESLQSPARSVSLWVHDLNTSEARKLMDLPGKVPQTTPSLAVSPDGRSVVYSSVDSIAGELFLIDNFH